MAIDLACEELLSLTDATKALPPIDGKRPCSSTIWRWCRRGVRGVRLEYVRLGHRVCTTREALGRFAQRLAEADDQPVENLKTRSTKPRSAKQRERDVARASKELECAGI
ncbi:MAG: DUF1580 domain-containing protein [Planctomycetes bacterium]|nr:DUF1580 domain-containing protein [Planctomycetota bacterium]